LKSKLKKLSNLKLEFPENVYNKNLKSKLSNLDKISTEANSIAEMGSGIGIVRAYRDLVSAYESIAKEVTSVTPTGKSPEYVTSFKKSMLKLSNQYLDSAQDLRTTAIKRIEKENILSNDNAWFLVKNDFGFIPEFYSDTGAAPMDKAGGK
jgi:hypothetical protein